MHDLVDRQESEQVMYELVLDPPVYQTQSVVSCVIEQKLNGMIPNTQILQSLVELCNMY